MGLHLGNVWTLLVGIAMVTAPGVARPVPEPPGSPGAPPRRPPTSPPAPGKAESIAILNTFLQLRENSRWKKCFKLFFF